MSLLARSIPLMGLLVGLASAALASSYDLINVLGPLLGPYGNTIVTGINNSGQIVGNIQTGQGTVPFLHSYSGGTYNTNIQDPLAPSNFFSSGTYLDGINNLGEIVGTYNDGTGTHVFVDNGGTFTTVPIDAPPGNTGLSVSGINDAGAIVGTYRDQTGRSFGFIYDGGTLATISAAPCGSGGTSISGINDVGEIVGNCGNGGAWINNGGTFTSFFGPGGPDSVGFYADGINDAGQVINSEIYEYHDFVGNFTFTKLVLYSHGRYGSIYNSDLYSVGNYNYAGGNFVLGAVGINDAGQVIGAWDPCFPGCAYASFVLTPSVTTPEPSPLAMEFTTFLGIAGYWTRKRFLRRANRAHHRHHAALRLGARPRTFAI